MKILNSISLNLAKNGCAPDFTYIKSIKVVDLKKIKKLESYIGHEDLAKFLGIKMNRAAAKLDDNEFFLVAQFVGGRLPLGARIEIHLYKINLRIKR
jgi:3-methyladenine DNA glycosylase Mpg